MLEKEPNYENVNKKVRFFLLGEQEDFFLLTTTPVPETTITLDTDISNENNSTNGTQTDDSGISTGFCHRCSSHSCHWNRCSSRLLYQKVFQESSSCSGKEGK